MAQRGLFDDVTLACTYSLANVTKELRRWPEAEVLFADLLNGYKEKYGDDHVETLRVMRELAFVYHRELKYAMAEESYRKLIRKYNLIEGEKTPKLVAVRKNLYRVLIDQEKYEQAAHMAKQMFELYHDLEGGYGKESVLALVAQAATSGCMGDNETASTKFKEALGYAPKLGREIEIQVKEAYAEFLKDTNKPEEAGRLYIEVMNDCRELYGPMHATSLRAIYNAGFIYCVAGEYEKARTLYRWVHDELEALGTPAEAMISWKINLANTMYELKEYTGAEVLYEFILGFYDEYEGTSTHPDAMAAMNNLGTVYQKTGQLDKAVAILRQCVEAKEVVYGREHSKTLMSKLNLAYTLGALERSMGTGGRSAEADALIEEVKNSQTTMRNFFMSSMELDPRFLPAGYPGSVLSDELSEADTPTPAPTPDPALG